MKFSKSKVNREINYDAFNPKRRREFKHIDSTLNANGLGYPQRLAVLSTINRESQGDPLAVSDNEKWKGLLQWDSLRYTPTSTDSNFELKNQTKHLNKELKGSGWNGNDSLKTIFYNSNILDDVNKAFVEGFVRPGNKEKETQIRYKNAVKGVVFPKFEFPAIDSSLNGVTNKYQDGGSLVYHSFVPEEQYENTSSTNELLNVDDTKYPVTPVKIYKPMPIQEINNTQKAEESEIEKNVPDVLKINGANNDNLNIINKELKSAGYKKTQRAAILATIIAESGANPMAVGDAGKAKGLFQWHPNRFSAGIDLNSQIQLLMNEIKDKRNVNAWTSSKKYNKELAFNTFHNTDDLKEAISVLTFNYIRPANTDREIEKRYNIAQKLISQMS